MRVANGLCSGCAVMMQAAMMLSAHDFALLENRRNFMPVSFGVSFH
jgi:hypothetical protein